MTEPPENTTEEVAAQKEQAAAEAYERIRSGQHYSDWRSIAEGLAVGRWRAMQRAYTNRPVGSAYNKEFGAWMDVNPWSRKLDTSTRNAAFWLAEHLAEVEHWRESLGANQREQWNHPMTLKRQFSRAHKAAVAKAAGAPVLSHVAQLKQAVVESQEEATRWKRRAEEGGSLFDMRRDTTKDMARVLVEQLTPSKVEALIRDLRVALKRQKQAHAG